MRSLVQPRQWALKLFFWNIEEWIKIIYKLYNQNENKILPEVIDFYYNSNNLLNKIAKKKDNKRIIWIKEFIKMIYYGFRKISGRKKNFN